MWIFLLFFGGNIVVRLFFVAMSTTMFDVDRNRVKYAIHTNNHTQSINYVLFRYNTKAVILLAGRPIRKYANDWCKGFFCSRLFVRVFVLCRIVFFGSESTNAPIHTTK